MCDWLVVARGLLAAYMCFAACLNAISLAAMNFSRQLLRHCSCGFVTLLLTAVALADEFTLGVPLWKHMRKHCWCADESI